MGRLGSNTPRAQSTTAPAGTPSPPPFNWNQSPVFPSLAAWRNHLGAAFVDYPNLDLPDRRKALAYILSAPFTPGHDKFKERKVPDGPPPPMDAVNAALAHIQHGDIGKGNQALASKGIHDPRDTQVRDKLATKYPTDTRPPVQASRPGAPDGSPPLLSHFTYWDEYRKNALEQLLAGVTEEELPPVLQRAFRSPGSRMTDSQAFIRARQVYETHSSDALALLSDALPSILTDTALGEEEWAKRYPTHSQYDQPDGAGPVLGGAMRAAHHLYTAPSQPSPSISSTASILPDTNTMPPPAPNAPPPPRT